MEDKAGKTSSKQASSNAGTNSLMSAYISAKEVGSKANCVVGLEAGTVLYIYTCSMAIWQKGIADITKEKMHM